MKAALRGDLLLRPRIYDASQMHKPYASEVAEVVALAGEVPPNCLDIGCGTGTHAIALAIMGVIVTGLDPDAEAIEVARAKANAVVPSNAPTFLVQAIGDGVDGEYALVTCLFNVVNYLLDEDAARAAFQIAASCLAPGGTFVFDAWTPRAERQSATEGHSRDFEFDGRSLRLRTLTTFQADGIVELQRDVFELSSESVEAELIASERIVHRVWSRTELVEFIGAAGLTVESIAPWGHVHPRDVDRAPLRYACRRSDGA